VTANSATFRPSEGGADGVLRVENLEFDSGTNLDRSR
jgi:hypothetical protein